MAVYILLSSLTNKNREAAPRDTKSASIHLCMESFREMKPCEWWIWNSFIAWKMTKFKAIVCCRYQTIQIKCHREHTQTQKPVHIKTKSGTEFKPKKRDIINSKPVQTDYARKLQKILFIYIFSSTFILSTKNKTTKKHASLCTLSFFQQHYFRLISDLWIVDFNAKNEPTTTTAPTIQNCKTPFFVACMLTVEAYSLVELNMKRKMCFWFPFLSLFIS